MTTKSIHVEGRDVGDVMLYALSTCIHCKKTRELLNELGIAYNYIYADQLPHDDMNELIKEMEKYNPRCSFPTLVFNGSKSIVGSRLDEIREILS